MTEHEVRHALDTIVDPCSAAAGAPAGLVEMGLVRDVRITDRPGGAHVRVRVGVTDPVCVMGASFVASAREVLGGLEGISGVDVELDSGLDWSPQDMSAAYAARLERVRARRRDGDQRAERSR